MKVKEFQDVRERHGEELKRGELQISDNKTSSFKISSFFFKCLVNAVFAAAQLFKQFPLQYLAFDKMSGWVLEGKA